MYLRYAHPWTHRSDEPAREVLEDIADDQRRWVERISDVLLAERAPIGRGEFPIEFTGIHDVSLDYLVGRLIDCQRADIETIAHCAAVLPENSTAKALAEEMLGAAKGHLQSLEELTLSGATS